MTKPISYVSTREAADLLNVDPATVINMINDGRLVGERGNQPRRPRWRVGVNADGYLVDKYGSVVPDQQLPRAGFGKEIQELRRRVDALEGGGRHSGPARADERYRDAALLLNEALSKQQQALDLQAQANRQLSEALTEQGRIIAGLLVPDPSEFTSASSKGRKSRGSR